MYGDTIIYPPNQNTFEIETGPIKTAGVNQDCPR